MTRSVLIADDHPLYRQALMLAVMQVAPDARVIEAGTLAEAARAASAEADLALVLLDLKMPGAVGFSGIALIHAERPEVPILVVSSAEGGGAAQEARTFGAIGFLRKDSELSEIEAAVARVLGGRRLPLRAGDEGQPPALSEIADAQLDPIRREVATLTPMQLKVLLAVLEGQLNKQIAFSLGITEATVKAHMTAVMKKLDVRNRTQAALVARSLGLHLQH